METTLSRELEESTVSDQILTEAIDLINRSENRIVLYLCMKILVKYFHQNYDSLIKLETILKLKFWTVNSEFVFKFIICISENLEKLQNVDISNYLYVVNSTLEKYQQFSKNAPENEWIKNRGFTYLLMSCKHILRIQSKHSHHSSLLKNITQIIRIRYLDLPGVHIKIEYVKFIAALVKYPKAFDKSLKIDEFNLIASDIVLNTEEACYFTGNTALMLNISIFRLFSALVLQLANLGKTEKSIKIVEDFSALFTAWSAEFHPIVEMTSNDDHKLIKILLELLLFYSKIPTDQKLRLTWLDPMVLLMNLLRYFRYDRFFIIDLLSNNIDFQIPNRPSEACGRRIFTMPVNFRRNVPIHHEIVQK
ncbi:hypothetical protein RF11_01100 [Thelohanellus kitauei]|uniref:Uncharacterized protein n=1 Tax=Thelohanellus kitauei TaxID=669202 RepID=A0A0C2JHH0_THEKT|nr:hypothetical protein RF11_01100 [Thelohanellus kitauei]